MTKVSMYLKEMYVLLGPLSYGAKKYSTIQRRYAQSIKILIISNQYPLILQE